jgi:hypothetical protein
VLGLLPSSPVKISLTISLATSIDWFRSSRASERSHVFDLVGSSPQSLNYDLDIYRGFRDYTDVTSLPSFPACFRYARVQPISQDLSTEGGLSRRGLSRGSRSGGAKTSLLGDILGTTLDFVHTEV